MNWMILPLKRYFEFRGRSRRTEFWMFVVFMILVGVVASILDMILGFGSASTYSGPGSYGMWMRTEGPINTLASLALIIPNLAVSVRRLHDIDRSGWWLLLVLIPFIGWIVLLVFDCTEGTRGPNRFGPDPKDPHGTDDVAEVFG